ncbi:hypothetical protein U1Q18_016600 [Sarracenia purpurea var. burkii]
MHFREKVSRERGSAGVVGVVADDGFDGFAVIPSSLAHRIKTVEVREPSSKARWVEHRRDKQSSRLEPSISLTPSSGNLKNPTKERGKGVVEEIGGVILEHNIGGKRGKSS